MQGNTQAGPMPGPKGPGLQKRKQSAAKASSVRGDIPGSRSRDIGYGFVDLERPDLESNQAMG